MYGIQAHATEDLAKARDGLEPIPGVGMMLLGHSDNGPLQVPEQSIIVPNQGQVGFDALLHGGLKTPLRHTVTVGFGGELLADLG
jgi:hypothetical protein